MGWSLILYAALLFLLAFRACPEGRRVAAGLALNWLFGAVAFKLNGDAVPIVAWFAADFVVCAWLLGVERTRIARAVGMLGFVIVPVDGLLAFRTVPWQDVALDVMAWAQILVLAFGVWGDGWWRTLVDYTADRRRHGRVVLSRFSRMAEVEAP